LYPKRPASEEIPAVKQGEEATVGEPHHYDVKQNPLGSRYAAIRYLSRSYVT
jgi:hypothetical protein